MKTRWAIIKISRYYDGRTSRSLELDPDEPMRYLKFETLAGAREYCRTADVHNGMLVRDHNEYEREYHATREGSTRYNELRWARHQAWLESIERGAHEGHS